MTTLKTTGKVALTVLWVLCCILCPVNLIATDRVLRGIWS